MNDPVVGAVGHDGGRVVLRLERLVPRSPDEVWHALTTLPYRQFWIRCGVEQTRNETPMVATGSRSRPEPAVIEWTSDIETVRCEVGNADGDARVVVTAWIDSDDVDVVAFAAADHHACFLRLMRELDTGSPGTRPPHACFNELTLRYRALVAAALADTD